MGFNLSNILNDIVHKVETRIGIGQFSGSNIGKSAGGDNIASGDVEIIDITAYNSVHTEGVSLANVAKEINIYESVFSPSIFATISILDAAGLMSTYNIGESADWYVNLEFKTPGSNKSSKYTLHINSRGPLENLENNLGAVYTFELCSNEVATNAGMNMTMFVRDRPHNAMRAILGDSTLKSEKPFHIEQEPDLPIDEPFANYKPFVVIDNLRRLCVSHRDISSCFVFYEDVDGYHLNTLENMIRAGATGLAGLAQDITGEQATDKVFFWDSTRQADSEATAFRNILAFNQSASADLQTEAGMGAFRMIARSFDPIQGGQWIDERDSGDLEPTNILIDVDGQPVQSSGIRNVRRDIARRDMHIEYADRPDRLLPEVITARMSFLADVARNVSLLHVYGDSELRLGDIIKTTFVTPSDIDPDNARPTRTSGNHLVTRIRHIIINNDRPIHTTAMEVIKTGVLEV